MLLTRFFSSCKKIKDKIIIIKRSFLVFFPPHLILNCALWNHTLPKLEERLQVCRHQSSTSLRGNKDWRRSQQWQVHPFGLTSTRVTHGQVKMAPGWGFSSFNCSVWLVFACGSTDFFLSFGVFRILVLYVAEEICWLSFKFLGG